MSRIQLLSPAQRTQLFSLSEEMSERDIVRYYAFSSDDLAIIRQQREEHNQVGFAVQLAYHRFPGRPFQMGEPMPQAVLAYVAAQVHASPEAFLQYAKRDTTRRQHIAKIQKLFGYRPWNRTAEQELTPFLLALALQTENGMVLTTALLEEMRRRQRLLPAASALEQFVSQIRTQADTAIFAQLTAALSVAQKERLDTLLTVWDGQETRFSWLKGFPRRPAASSILRVTAHNKNGVDPQTCQVSAHNQCK